MRNARRSRRPALVGAVLLVVYIALSSSGALGSPNPSAQGPEGCAVPTVDDRCEEWTASYDNPNGYGGSDYPFLAGRDIPHGIAVAPGGDRVYVTGTTEDRARGSQPRREDMVTLAYDARSGTALWKHSFNGPDNSFDAGDAITVTSDGSRVFVAGRSGSSAMVVCYDASGTMRWSRLYKPLAPGSVDDVEIRWGRDEATLYLGGLWDAIDFDSEGVMAAALDPETGELRWIRTYAGLGHTSQVVGFEVDPFDRRVYVGAYAVPTDAGGPGDYAVVAFDASGANHDVLWAMTQTASDGVDRPAAMGISPDGRRIYITGESEYVAGPLLSGREALTLAVDAETGATAWEATHRWSESGINPVNGLAVSPTGDRIFVTGRAGSTSVGIVAYDAATGRVDWDLATGLPSTFQKGETATVSPDGRHLFVLGYACEQHATDRGGKEDFLVIALDADTSEQRWVGRWTGLVDHGPLSGWDPDGPRSIAVAPDGSMVYAAAATNPAAAAPTANRNWRDITVLAYQA